MHTITLTPRQVEVVRLIRGSRDRRGYSPTLHEMAKALGVGKVTVYEHVSALVRKGVLRREGGRTARNLTIAEGVEVPGEAEDESSLRAELDRRRRERDELLDACEHVAASAAGDRDRDIGAVVPWDAIDLVKDAIDLCARNGEVAA